MGRVKEYKGYSLQFTTPHFGFYSSGRGGKVVRKVWVESLLTPGFGKWCNSEAEAKRWVNEELKKGIVGI